MSTKFVAGKRIPMTAEEIADAQAREAAEAQRQAAEAAALAAKLAKRPKRSQINATLAAIDTARTMPELRAAVANLAVMMRDVLDLQAVPVVEDE